MAPYHNILGVRKAVSNREEWHHCKAAKKRRLERRTTLLYTIHKILAIIIKGRLPDNSYTQISNTLRIIIKQSLEWHTLQYVLFVDFKRTFDTIKHAVIIETIE